jgi:hypothetical protein
MIRSAAWLAILGALLGGCAGGASKPASSSGRAPAAPRSSIVVVPEVMAPQGLDGVIGSPAPALTGRFGTPRLDVAEGDARKLQFAGATCVLDIYLYPVTATAEPTATHVEARVRQGGAALDAGACIREVERR